MGTCEAGDLWCLTIQGWNALVTAVAFAAGVIWAWISKYLPFADAVLGRVAMGVNRVFAWAGERERLQALGTLAGVSFGIYKWWYNRESMLMRRMLDVLRTRDRRLGNIRQDAVASIATPGPGAQHAIPLFVVGSLQRVLRRRRWLPLLRVQTLPTATDRALQKAAGRLNRLIGAAETIAASRRSELFTANMLQGALASARSGRFRTEEQQAAQNNIARRHFEDALGITGFAGDRLARECLGIQFMKLREFDKAIEIFHALEEDALAETDEHARAVHAGRAAYFIGLTVAKADAPDPSWNANQHLIRASGHLDAQGPFSDLREQLQFARTHELHACVRQHLGYAIEAQSLQAARDRYSELKANPALSTRITDWVLWFRPSVRERRQGTKDILREVDAALKRIDERNNGQRVCVCGKAAPG